MLDGCFDATTVASPYTLDVTNSDILKIVAALQDGSEKTSAELVKLTGISKNRLSQAMRVAQQRGILVNKLRNGPRRQSVLCYMYSLARPKTGEDETKDVVHEDSPLQGESVRRVYRTWERSGYRGRRTPGKPVLP